MNWHKGGSMDSHIWTDDLSTGTKAERMVLSWTGGKNGFNDLLINVEVKNSWHGGDICIEEDSIKEQGKKGWIYTTNADNVIFVDYDKENAALIETSHLKQIYEQVKDNYPLNTQTTTDNGHTWTSTHRRIPLSKFAYVFMHSVGFKLKQSAPQVTNYQQPAQQITVNDLDLDDIDRNL